MPGTGRGARSFVFRAADRKGLAGTIWSFVKENFKFYVRWAGRGPRPMDFDEVLKTANDGV
eukprot:8921639-Lingulodinium_polyedra.AAC.1